MEFKDLLTKVWLVAICLLFTSVFAGPVKDGHPGSNFVDFSEKFSEPRSNFGKMSSLQSFARDRDRRDGYHHDVYAPEISGILMAGLGLLAIGLVGKFQGKE